VNAVNSPRVQTVDVSSAHVASGPCDKHHRTGAFGKTNAGQRDARRQALTANHGAHDTEPDVGAGKPVITAVTEDDARAMVDLVEHLFETLYVAGKVARDQLADMGQARALQQGLAGYTQTDIMTVKPIRFLGDSLRRLREFPREAKHDAGYQLDQVQRGKQPADFKPMPSIGKGVEEIRVWDDSGAYRMIYTARLVDAVYVLHAFQKKTQATAKQDLDLARERFAQLMKARR
jgi:phage-related protein